MKLIITLDGSHSLSLTGSEESYHSTHGAIQESQYIFIEAGLNYWTEQQSSRPIRILEIGFGTGLNALIALKVSESLGSISYTTIEPFPLEERLWTQLNYSKQLEISPDLFSSLHRANWEQKLPISKEFSFYKTKTFFEKCTFDSLFDVVFFDAFSPEIQPELWTASFFQLVFDSMSPSGVLVTYCVKGIVKRALKSAGFTLERLPGPPGKRHMLRALKASE